MNKKGFTLVELLAVVAITAIILLIAIPNVMEGLNESKMNNFGNEVSTIYSSAKTQFNLEKGRGQVKYTYDNYERKAIYCQNWTENPEDCKNELSNENQTGMSYKIVLDVDGNVDYMHITDGRFLYICNDSDECGHRNLEACNDGESGNNCILDLSAGSSSPNTNSNQFNSSFCLFDYNNNRHHIPFNSGMTWNEFFSYAKNDSRFVYEVESVCSFQPLNCYVKGEDADFDAYLNNSNYYKHYRLMYNNKVLGFYTPEFNNPSVYHWEGIDSYILEDNSWNGYSIFDNINSEIEDYDSGKCYCVGCG